MTAIPACMRAANTARLMRTAVLLPMTVARAEEYVEVADVLEFVPLDAVVLPLEMLLLFEPPPQAVVTSPAATITPIADSREQLRSIRTSPLLLRLVKADGDHVEVARALSLGVGTVAVLSSVCGVTELTCTNWAAVG